LPGATRLNRGGTVVADLVASARAHDFTDLLVLHEHRGQPDGLVVCHLPFGPTAYFGVYNAVREGGEREGGEREEGSARTP
jgi:U3 small nucleolar ribonucleoprotein protein IMP4